MLLSVVIRAGRYTVVQEFIIKAQQANQQALRDVNNLMCNDMMNFKTSANH